MAQKKAPAVVSIGITLLFLISMGVSYATALLPRFAEYYPTVDPSNYSYIMSICFLGVMVGALVAGALTPKFVGYKVTATIGSLLFLVFGILPVWMHDSFMLMVVFRFFVGAGAGFMTPLANGLVTAFYEGDARAKLLSVGSAAGQIGAVAMQMLTGILGDISFWLAFASPAVAILSVIGALFLIKEPEKVAAPVEEKKAERGGLGGRVWYCAILETICCLALMPFLFNYAFYVAEVSDSLTMATTVQAMYTVGMVIGGLIYFMLFKICKRRTVGVSMLLCAIGVLLFITLGKGSLPFMFIGMLVAGLGYGSFLPAMMSIVGFACKPALVAFATSLLMVFMNIASFISTPFIGVVAGVTGDPVVAPIWAGWVIFVVCMILLFVVSPYPKDITPMLKAGEKAEAADDAAAQGAVA